MIWYGDQLFPEMTMRFHFLYNLFALHQRIMRGEEVKVEIKGGPWPVYGGTF